MFVLQRILMPCRVDLISCTICGLVLKVKCLLRGRRRLFFTREWTLNVTSGYHEGEKKKGSFVLPLIHVNFGRIISTGSPSYIDQNTRYIAKH